MRHVKSRQKYLTVAAGGDFSPPLAATIVASNDAIVFTKYFIAFCRFVVLLILVKILVKSNCG